MKDRFGTVLYVGKAKDLKKRVSTYFQPSRRFLNEQPKVAAMIKLVATFEHIEVRSEAEALLLEGRLIKEWKPRYNTDFTDDKRFLQVRVDTENELPRFRLTRIRKDANSVYFGPFAHSRLLRKTLAEMRRRFGILLETGGPRRGLTALGLFTTTPVPRFTATPMSFPVRSIVSGWARPAYFSKASRVSGWRSSSKR